MNEAQMFRVSQEPEAFAAGVRPGAAWSRLGNVAGLPRTEYRVGVVGPAAAGYGLKADLFVVALPDSAPAFQSSGVSVFGYPEFTNTQPVIPDLFIHTPPSPPMAEYSTTVPGVPK
jgi:hypothetical protein